VRKIQQQLLDSYERDLSKHAPASIVPRIRLVWNSVASQLAKENRKFVYGALRKNARAKEFELAIQWLKDAGLIHIVSRVAKPGIPLSSYQDKSFKIFALDIGLLGALSGLDAQSILLGNQIFEEFKGALTEQYVLQQLISECRLTPYYWSTENSSGEIDFIFQHERRVIPLEVKAEENLKARSLMFYSRKNRVPLAFRASMSDYREDKVAAIASHKDDSEFQFNLFNLPLYAISQITAVCNTSNI
jgi:predicted AAA+ superfamily ATPase